MFTQTLTRVLLVAACLTAGFTLSPAVQAGCIGCKTSQCCPKCKHVCKLTAEKVDVDKACFEVETDYVCIPRVVFPWQRPAKSSCGLCKACDGSGCKSCSACPNNGARIRKINKLKVKKYNCPECEYSWDTEKIGGCGSCGSSCGDSCASGCSSGNCDAGCACRDITHSKTVEPPAMDLQQIQSAALPSSSEHVMVEPMQTEVPAAVPAPVYTEQVPGAADYYAPPTPQN